MSTLQRTCRIVRPRGSETVNLHVETVLPGICEADARTLAARLADSDPTSYPFWERGTWVRDGRCHRLAKSPRDLAGDICDRLIPAHDGPWDFYEETRYWLEVFGPEGGELAHAICAELRRRGDLAKREIDQIRGERRGEVVR